MKKPHIIHQIWPFTCLTCQHAWESAYEAWHADDGRGGQVITWRHKGTASTPPWIEPVCPACSGLQVKTLPPGALPGRDRPPPNGQRLSPDGRRRPATDPRPGVPPQRRRR